VTPRERRKRTGIRLRERSSGSRAVLPAPNVHGDPRAPLLRTSESTALLCGNLLV
jgi:hypothetical protein